MMCSIAGCYEHTTRGNESFYQFASWLGPVIIGAGILAIPIGWLTRKSKLGFVLMCMGPVLLLFVAPAMYSDRVVIDDDHFEAHYGLWFNPSVRNVRFSDLREIRYVSVQGTRGRIKYELHCVNKNGNEAVVPAGDLIKYTVQEIMTRAKAKGVIIVDQTF
jgi:hypothetical protein